MTVLYTKKLLLKRQVYVSPVLVGVLFFFLAETLFKNSTKNLVMVKNWKLDSWEESELQFRREDRDKGDCADFSALEDFFFLLQREGGFILNLGIVHLKSHRKKSEIKIHNILFRFVHRFLLQWLLLNIGSEPKCRMLNSTTIPKILNMMQDPTLNPKRWCVLSS